MYMRLYPVVFNPSERNSMHQDNMHQCHGSPDEQSECTFHSQGPSIAIHWLLAAAFWWLPYDDGNQNKFLCWMGRRKLTNVKWNRSCFFRARAVEQDSVIMLLNKVPSSPNKMLNFGAPFYPK